MTDPNHNGPAGEPGAITTAPISYYLHFAADKPAPEISPSAYRHAPQPECGCYDCRQFRRA